MAIIRTEIGVFLTEMAIIRTEIGVFLTEMAILLTKNTRFLTERLLTNRNTREAKQRGAIQSLNTGLPAVLGSRCWLDKLSTTDPPRRTITTDMAIIRTEIAIFLTEMAILLTKNTRFLTEISHITINTQKSIRKSPYRDSQMLLEMVLLNNS